MNFFEELAKKGAELAKNIINKGAEIGNEILNQAGKIVPKEVVDVVKADIEYKRSAFNLGVSVVGGGSQLLGKGVDKGIDFIKESALKLGDDDLKILNNTGKLLGGIAGGVEMLSNITKNPIFKTGILKKLPIIGPIAAFATDTYDLATKKISPERFAYRTFGNVVGLLPPAGPFFSGGMSILEDAVFEEGGIKKSFDKGLQNAVLTATFLKNSKNYRSPDLGTVICDTKSAQQNILQKNGIKFGVKLKALLIDI
jgi:hypothetical protein